MKERIETPENERKSQKIHLEVEKAEEPKQQNRMERRNTECPHLTDLNI